MNSALWASVSPLERWRSLILLDPPASHDGILDPWAADSCPSRPLWLYPRGDLMVILTLNSHRSAPLSSALLLEV